MQFETEFSQDRENGGEAGEGVHAWGGVRRQRGQPHGKPAFSVYGEQSAKLGAIHDWQIRPILNVMGEVVHIDCFCIQGMTEAGNKVMATLRGAIENAVLSVMADFCSFGPPPATVRA